MVRVVAGSSPVGRPTFKSGKFQECLKIRGAKTEGKTPNGFFSAGQLPSFYHKYLSRDKGGALLPKTPRDKNFGDDRPPARTRLGCFGYGYSKESMASQQATYVQISRAREETKLYIVAGERGLEREEVSKKINAEQRQEVLEEMKKGWSHNAAKDTTIEHKALKQQQEIKKELKQERGYELGM